jgi:hypothetical protein
MKLHCPNCKNENIQSVPIAYESGTSTSSSTSFTVGAIGNIGHASAMGAVTESQSSSATLIAARLAPPEKKGFKSGCIFIGALWLACLLFLSSILCLGNIGSSDQDGRTMFWVGLVMAIGSAWYLRKLKNKISAEKQEIERYNEEEYPKKVAEWRSHWFCSKCGFTGKLDVSTDHDIL